MEAILIDAFEFCRLKEAREGEFAVAHLPRLAGEAVTSAGTIRWALAGSANHLGHPQMALSISGSVQLRCQRCLSPFEFVIDSRSTLVLAQDEASADHMEDLLDDETVEVIVASRQFNVTDLIEDEALLTLPSAPKHDVCPEQAELDPQVNAAKKPSPFDVLKNWKR